MNKPYSSSAVLTRPHTCRNCGYDGHLYKECPHPITSFGIICYRIKNNNLNNKDSKTNKEDENNVEDSEIDQNSKNNEKDVEYLMIQRKDSLCFMEFIRGKYDIKNIQYIKQLLNGMTKTEQKSMLILSFEELWNYIWFQQSIHKQTSEFNNAKNKFTNLKNGITIDNNVITLEKLIDECNTIYDEPEWGFPKGRRKIHEQDMNCAIREFGEETGIHSSEIEIIENMPPFEEIFFGTNHVLYRHVYYIAKMNFTNSNVISINTSNINQVREVRAIKWFSFNDTMNSIRNYNKERKQIFREAHNKIIDYEKTKTLGVVKS